MGFDRNTRQNAALNLYDNILHQLDIKKHHLPLSKAGSFDIIDHSTVLLKLKYYGIDDLACNTHPIPCNTHP